MHLVQGQILKILIVGMEFSAYKSRFLSFTQCRFEAAGSLRRYQVASQKTEPSAPVPSQTVALRRMTSCTADLRRSWNPWHPTGAVTGCQREPAVRLENRRRTCEAEGKERGAALRSRKQTPRIPDAPSDMDLEAHLSSALPRVDVAAARAELEQAARTSPAPAPADSFSSRTREIPGAGAESCRGSDLLQGVSWIKANLSRECGGRRP